MKFDPLSLSDLFLKTMHKLWEDPQTAIKNNVELAKNYSQLWGNVTKRMLGLPADTIYGGDGKDKRFKDETWEENPVFNFIKQSYFLNASWIKGITQKVEGLDSKDAKKLDFYTRVMIDAMAPTNFFLTNPEVLKETIKTQGANLVKGTQNFLGDLNKSPDKFAISTVDLKAFAVGRNLAVTPGKVVYQNDLMQLIQYSPSTEKVYETPLLIIPAWINKYYILDLQKENSFVRWLVSKGYTVFMISWANPSDAHHNKTFEDYMVQGALAAITEVQKLVGEKEISTMGYCLGGTLLAITIAYLKKLKSKCPIKNATFLTSLVDFCDSGDLGVFIDEEQLAILEKRMSEKGYLDGHEMATTFSMIRANDMIWSFYINNYMMGRDPFPFDILYWNSDSTRLPAKMHSFYLRNMYLKNLLVKPGGISLKNTPIDLTKVDISVYMLSTKEDHIAPWESTYHATQIYKGPVRFTLSASGHVAGVVNHPDKMKYNFWTNSENPPSAQQWLKGAKSTDGSWWVDWDAWAAPKSGKKIAARKVAKGLGDAPGSYVLAK